MPPKKKISAPANRVYKSSTLLQQTRLPSPKKRIRSYGKQTGVRKLKKDNTLTQMDFVKLLEQKSREEEEEEDDDSVYEEQSAKRQSKRRKTMGDEPSRTPQFHTQTLTQLDRSFSAPEEEEAGEPESDVFDGLYSSQTAKPKTGRKQTKTIADIPEEVVPPSREMPPPQTPRRITALEIPSSQSPGTPFSVHSQGSARRSPLKDKSINTPIPFNPRRKEAGDASAVAPGLEVKDTFDTESDVSQMIRFPSSPPRRSSPAKIVRFAMPQDAEEELEEEVEEEVEGEVEGQLEGEVEEEVEEEEETQEIEPAEPAEPTLLSVESEIITQAFLGTALESSKFEIEDSDAESGEEDLLDGNIEEDSVIVPQGLKIPLNDIHPEEEPEPDDLGTQGSLILGEDHEMEEQEPETCYGDIGLETQFAAAKMLDSPQLDSPRMTRSQAKRTQEEHHEETFQERTQIMESQRLETQYIAAMAPRTMDSDVFLSMHPQQVTNIITRAKNHETRAWGLPLTTCRIWIYETAPVMTLKYMAEIGPAKCPGELLDETGLGNVEFNSKRPSWRAYEIRQLYELADPYPLSKLISNEWIKEPPKRYAKVRPAVLDELMANLMHPLFVDESLPPPSSSTDTQEAEAQLMSTIKQFTQASYPPLSSPRQASPIPDEIFPSSQHELPRPSQAETVDLTQTQTPSHPRSEIIFESPTRPVPSSTPMKLPTPRSGRGRKDHDSLVPFSMASSQLLTKSQMLSDSLLNDSVPGPPPFVVDSEDEDEL